MEPAAAYAGESITPSWQVLYPRDLET